jgi:LysM repeat protein
MRKIFLFFLLLSGWMVIFSPWLSEKPILSSAFRTQVHPSSRPLTPAWQDTQRVPVMITSGQANTGELLAASSKSSGVCGDLYSIEKGDTLGDIARQCGLSLVELLDANPHILNPDRIYPGQRISFPNPQAGRGGAEPSTASSQTGGIQPGSVLEIDAAGLPPNTRVRIGLGLSSSGYFVLGEQQTSAEGRLSLDLALPYDIRAGEKGFIMITTLETPALQRTSETFVIGQ